MTTAVLLGRPTGRELALRLLGTTQRAPRGFWPALLLAMSLSLLFLGGAAYTVVTGIGVWGNNIPVGWAFGITNFVFWIGIGHAGTFISAFLVLLKQPWRSSINRVAEAMTIFALLIAASFPVLHLGRPWFAYWLIPYPSTMRLWPQFRSALPWDLAAISTYGSVSLLFWYVGMIPDFASLRDHASGTTRRRIWGVLALGWRGSANEWRHYQIAYGLFAGLATPLVLSVHSIVSMDFAISVLPGWHSTVFPPYFVAGALFSGFGMILTILIPVRWWYGLHDVITARHLEMVAKMTLTTSFMVGYGYFTEIYLAWRSHDPYERFLLLLSRPFGPHALAFWIMIACNVLVPQLLWVRGIRRSARFWLFPISILVNVGMWFERFVLIITSQERDFLPSSWDEFAPSPVDLLMLAGTFGLFATLMIAFLRLFPFIPVHEMQVLLSHRAHEERRS